MLVSKHLRAASDPAEDSGGLFCIRLAERFMEYTLLVWDEERTKNCGVEAGADPEGNATSEEGSSQMGREDPHVHRVARPAEWPTLDDGRGGRVTANRWPPSGGPRLR